VNYITSIKFCHSVYCASCTYNDSFGQRVWRESFWKT